MPVADDAHIKKYLILWFRFQMSSFTPSDAV